MTATVATRPAHFRKVSLEDALVPITGAWGEVGSIQSAECDWSPFQSTPYYLGCSSGTGGVITNHLVRLVSAHWTGSRARLVVNGNEAEMPDSREPISSMVNRIRISFGLSITDLASVLAVERPTIYSWLKDASAPAASRLSRVRQVLQLADVWTAVGGQGAPAPTSEVAPGVTLLSALREPRLWGSEIERNLRAQASVKPNSRKAKLLDLAQGAGISPRAPSDFDFATGRPLAPEL